MNKKLRITFISIISVFLFGLISCQNFLSGEDVRKSIEEAIEHEQAAFCNVQISANIAEVAKMVPAPNITYTDKYKPSDYIDLSFEPSENYFFLYWEARPEGCVEFEEFKELTTRAKIKDERDVVIIPHCVPRPSPIFEPNMTSGVVPKNSSILITFGDDPLAVPEKDLKNISITIAGEDITEYYEEPKYVDSSKRQIQITAKKDKILDFTSGEKTVTVTVPKEFYIHNGYGFDIPMAKDFSGLFKINHKTKEKLDLYLDNNDEYGKFERGNQLYEKFLNEVQTITYTLRANCVFTGWDFYLEGEIAGQSTLHTKDIENIDGEKETIVYHKDDSGIETELLRLVEPNDADAAILDERNMHQVTFEVLNGFSSSINLKPQAYKTPGVESYTPSKLKQGVRCDTPVFVTFNTLINHNSFDLSTNGSISIRNKNDVSISYNNYYTFSVEDFQEDLTNKTRLTLWPDASITELFNDNVNALFEINIKFDAGKIIAIDEVGRDTTNITETNSSYDYIINNSTEEGKPQITKLCLYKTKNDDGTYENPLTDKDFDCWDDEDFYLNHAKEFYVVLEGYDSESGLDCISYKEELFKTQVGTDSNLDPVEAKLGSSMDFEATDNLTEDYNFIYKLEKKFEFNKSYPDGVMKYEFALKDRAGNISPDTQKKTYYVIKDSGIAGDNIKDSGRLSYYRKAVDGIDTVKFKFEDNNLKDKFFSFGADENASSYSDSLVIKKVEWGYSTKFEMGEVVSKYEIDKIEYIDRDEETGEMEKVPYPDAGYFYTIKRDETRETYLKVTVEDSVGNVYSKMVAIPEKAIYIGKRDTEPLFKAFNTECPLSYSSAGINYYQSNDSAEYLMGGYGSRYDLREEGHLVDGVTYISSGGVHDRFLEVANKYDFNGWNVAGTACQVYDKQAVCDELTDEDMPSDLNLTFEEQPAELNSGYTEFKVSYPSSFQKNPDYLYLTAIRTEGHSRYTYTESNYVKVQSGTDYYIRPAVMSPDRKFKYGEEVKLQTTQDTTPPNLEFIGDSSGTHEHYQRNAGYIRVEVPKDNSDTKDSKGIPVTGMKADRNGIVTIEYWIIANESIDSGFKERSEEDIISYPKHTITYDSKNPPTYLRLPMDGSPENSYSVYIKLEDKYGNYKFKSVYALNVLRNDKPTFEYKKVEPVVDSWNIGLYESWHTGIVDEENAYAKDPDPNWWNDKVPGGENWWSNGCGLLTEEEIDSCSNYEEMRALQYAKEYDLVSEYIKEHYTYGEEQDAFVLNTGTSYGGNLVIDIYDQESGKWNEKNTIQQMYECREMIFFKDAFDEEERYNLQFFHKNGGNWDMYNWNFDLFSNSEKFVRFSSYDTSDSSGNLKDYTKVLYVYPEYYKGEMSCDSAAIQPVINGVQVFADNPVLVHTYYCSSDLGDDPDMWLNHGLEVGIVQKKGSFTYTNKNLSEVPSGKYYVTIAHFVDGTTLMTEVSKKK